MLSVQRGWMESEHLKKRHVPLRLTLQVTWNRRRWPKMQPAAVYNEEISAYIIAL